MESQYLKAVLCMESQYLKAVLCMESQYSRAVLCMDQGGALYGKPVLQGGKTST
jgi:hypothetical protein